MYIQIHKELKKFLWDDCLKIFPYTVQFMAEWNPENNYYWWFRDRELYFRQCYFHYLWIRISVSKRSAYASAANLSIRYSSVVGFLVKAN